MARVLLLCGYISVQIVLCLSYRQSNPGCNSTEFACDDGLQCISSFYRCDGGPPDCNDGSDEDHCREQEDFSLGQYFLEAVDWMKKKDTPWRYFLPEDTDIDQDGEISDLEVQHKFNTYMGEVFKLIDQDKDNSITEEEFRSLKLDIPQLTKAVDIALENFPLRPFFLTVDANEDGFYDENDFLMPEKISRAHLPSFENVSISTNISIRDDFRVILKQSNWDDWKQDWRHYKFGVTNIGQNEGTVICKSLGFAGLERIMEIKWSDGKVAFSCEGTEERLEDCKETTNMLSNFTSHAGMGVECKGPNKFDTPRLVGGKDSSSGDVFVGDLGLGCIEVDSNTTKMDTFQVICRQLGYSGVLRMTGRSAFTGIHYSYTGYIEKIRKEKFKCEGNEEKLADCPKGGHCSANWVQGVVCATEGRSGLNQGLMDLLAWDESRVLWDEGGRFLFIADANGDGKLTLQELATKAKELLTKILEFLDENQDGKISLEDINLHLTVGPIQNMVSELFDDVTAGKGELDIYNLEIAGQNMNKYFYRGVNPLTKFDNNGDGKLNAADTFYRSRHDRSPSEESFLLTMLSEKLDKNQDGKIQREELRQFIDEMFNQIDMDKDGALTLEDVYSLLRANGLNCLQVGAFRSFTRVFLDKIDAVTRDFFSYIFHQLDIDGNGQISTTEMEQMRAPCESRKPRGRDYGYRGPSSGYSRDYGYRGPSSGYGRDYGYRGPSSGYGGDYGYRGPSSGYGMDYGYRGPSSGYGRDFGYRGPSSGYGRDYGYRGPSSGYRDYGYRGPSSGYGISTTSNPRFFSGTYGPDLSPRPTMAADPYPRKTCSDMYQTYFGTKITDLIRSFPEFVFSESHGRRPGGYGGARDQPKKETLVDKLTKHACEMLT